MTGRKFFSFSGNYNMTFMYICQWLLCLFCPLGHTLPGGVCCGSADWLVRPSGDPGGARRLWSGAGGGQVSLKHTQWHPTQSRQSQLLRWAKCLPPGFEINQQLSSSLCWCTHFSPLFCGQPFPFFADIRHGAHIFRIVVCVQWRQQFQMCACLRLHTMWAMTKVVY